VRAQWNNVTCLHILILRGRKLPPLLYKFTFFSFLFLVSPCDNNPCENNGTCSVDVNGNATCTCDGNWNGTYCQGNHIFRN
jgi:hypothetical protein